MKKSAIKHRMIKSMAACLLAVGSVTLGVADAAPAPLTTSSSASGFTASQWQHVLTGKWRSKENKARDVYRHPQATLEFFGLTQGMTVIEISPGGGWYTEILAPLLQNDGHYIAAVQKADKSGEAGGAVVALRAEFASNAKLYGQAQVVEFDPQAPVFGAPESADMVLTFRNVHDWVAGDTNTAPAMFKGFYAVLRPGGVLGVVDHRAAAGASVDAGKLSGYLPTDYIIKLATGAGFKLAAQSEINANPKDTKDYHQGVWVLPPTLQLGEQDKAKYMAIGESDRMTLRFVKPDTSP